MKALRTLAITIAHAAACTLAAAASFHTDDFQSDLTTAGWGGNASPTFESGGGPSGASDPFLEISTFNYKLASYNFDDRWIGDYTALGATSIKVDLMAPATSTAPLPIRLVLFGPTSTSDRWTSAAPQTVPNDGVWRHYTFSLARNDIIKADPVFTTGTYDEMMASVLRVMFRYDPDPVDWGGIPVNGTAVLGLDNIQLVGASAPIPGDFNGDGMVSGADLTDPTLGWKARFGVDLGGGDFLVWQQNLGSGASTGAIGAVPEPASFALAALAIAGALSPTRRGRFQRHS